MDDEFKAKLKIVKQDDETKQPVLLANTEFKVYDLDAKKYVEQVTTYPNTVVHKSIYGRKWLPDPSGILKMRKLQDRGSERTGWLHSEYPVCGDQS